MWKATVRRAGDEFEWRFQVPSNTAQHRLFRFATTRDPHILWAPDVVPDLPVMNERSRRAMVGGASGYQHEFRVRDGDRIVWIAEDVAIERVGSDEWSLVGVAADVTARREAEELSSRNAAHLHNLLERADCMLWEARVERVGGEFHWSFDLPVSGLSQTLFGSRAPGSCNGVTGKVSATIYGGYPVIEQAEVDQRSLHALENDLPGYQQEFRVQAPNKIYWLQEQVSIARTGPDTWSLVGVTIDLTARREAEAAREVTEQRLHEVLARAECMIWEASVDQQPDGTFSWRFYTPPSHLYRTIFGTDPNPAQARFWAHATVPEIEQMHERSQGAMRSGASGYSQEFRVLQGERTRWLYEQVAIRSVGDKAWQLTGVVTDITARRTAEIALATETERLAVTLRSMTEGVITTDTTGRVQFLNRAAAGLIEYPADEASGYRLAELCHFVEARSGKAYALPLDHVLQDGLAFTLPANTALVQGPGRQRLVAGRCAPVRDASSRIIGAILVLDDITERHRLDEHLQRASKLESIGVLAGGIAHDFNNILTALMGNISLALLDLPEQSPAAQVLADARSATTRARELTQQLLTFAKGGDPIRTTVQLPELITEIARFALHGSSMACEFDLPDNLWSADADKGQFGQIIQNLVLNAVQATGGQGRIRISAANTEITGETHLPLHPGIYVRVTVADNGQGIAPENLSRVFDPYFTTKEQGHGLGLATVYSIIQRHGGHIEVDSAVGLGTSISLWLPAQRGAAPGKEPAEPAPGNAGRVNSTGHGRVLFMDDEAAIRRLGGAMLRRLGFEVELAADGAEAIRLYQAAHDTGRPFDLVVVDLTIPGGMGGREAVEILRGIDPHVRAIVSSGYSSDPVLANHRAYGFCGMVAKPYQVEQFADVIRQALRRPAPAE